MALVDWASPEEIAAGQAWRERQRWPFMSVHVAGQNLLRVGDVLDAYGVGHYLIKGTLLGAVREGKLIAHDTDVDLAVLGTDRPKLETMLMERALARQALDIGRLGEDLVSVIRGGEYVDLYIFDREGDDYRCQSFTIPAWQIERPSRITLLGRRWQTVADPPKYLADKYGGDWRTPVVGRHSID